MTSLDPMHKKVGQRLEAARENAGLSRVQLAEAMGYKYPEKGAQKIALWERGEKPPRGDRLDLLQKFLELPHGEVRALHLLLDNDARRQSRGVGPELYDSVHGVLDEESMVARNLETLMEHREAIIQNSEHGGVPVGGAAAGLAYMGGRDLTLGELLHLWSHSLLSFPCPCCHGTFFVTRAGGSPLSGSYSIRGFCSKKRNIRAGKLPQGTSIGGMVQHALKGDHSIELNKSGESLQGILEYYVEA